MGAPPLDAYRCDRDPRRASNQVVARPVAHQMADDLYLPLAFSLASSLGAYAVLARRGSVDLCAALFRCRAAVARAGLEPATNGLPSRGSGQFPISPVFYCVAV